MTRSLVLVAVAAVAQAAPPHAKLAPPPAEAVRWTGGFWGERFDLVRRTTFHWMWQSVQKPDNGASIRPFRVAAGLEKGDFQARNWSDGDVYKWIETGAHLYALTRDPAIDRLMDAAIADIARAQAPDGYIATQTQTTGRPRWANFNLHELYNMGHLLTAASVHFNATGKRNFLEVAIRTADFLHRTFTPRPKELAHFGFNPSNIMGCVDLYRATGNSKYLDLAGVFVEMRGSAPGGTDLNQTRRPLRKETEAVGHAVTANYLYAGAADVYAETGEKALWAALERIWRDVATRKLAVTGAVGAVSPGVSPRGDPTHEAYGFEYELPNRTSYNETCANIAAAMWSWRMFNLTGEPKYADVVETVLYNSMLAAISLDGKSFFYGNPLRVYAAELPFKGNRQYQRWPDTSIPGVPRSYCCPPSISRTIASVNRWAYSVAPDAVWVNLYGSSTIEVGGMHLAQETRYPWEGDVRITVKSAPAAAHGIRLRVPAWADGATVRINGQAGPPAVPGAYLELRRAWRAGDRIDLHLPLMPRMIESHPLVEETRHHAAVARGPLVYVLESVDLPAGVRFDEVLLPAAIQWRTAPAPQLPGILALEGEGLRIPQGEWTDRLYRALRPAAPERVKVRLIPYYAWANRGASQMTVWIPLAR